MKKNLFIFYLLVLYSSSYSLRESDSLVEMAKLAEEDNITEEIQINIKYNTAVYIGNTYNFYFETDYNDTILNIFNNSDIEEKTSFITQIYYSSTNYDVACHLWNPVNQNFKLFCQLLEKRWTYYPNIYLKKGEFTYGKYKINIIPPPSSKKFTLNQLKPVIPFLYSDEQVINMDNDRDIYELKFKMKEYDNQLLFLYSNEFKLYLDKCSKDDNYLICKITKEEIEEILEYNNQKFDIYSFTESYPLFLYRIDLINNITINDNIIKKQNIYVEITKLAQKTIIGTDFVTYETNVTSTSNFISGKFNIQKKYGSLLTPNYDNCYFKKTLNSPLLFLCQKIFLKDYLGEIREETILNNSSIKYDFYIQPVKNYEKMIFDGYFVTAFFVFPKLLDFNSNEELIINYMMKGILFLNNLRLNADSNNLNCSSRDIHLKCSVNRKHFENLKSGYYYTYHFSGDKSSSIIYELSPIQVIIPDDRRIYINVKGRDNKDSILIGKNKILYFETSFNNSEMNIFDKDDIDQIKFNITITDNNKNNYEIDCFFLHQNNHNMGIICYLKEDLINGTEKIILNDAQFSYKDYNIIIFSYDYINIELYNCTIPFLYSDTQFINIKEQEESYNLQFHIKAYNNEVLMLYDLDSKMKYSVLNYCQTNNEIINCKISKEKLEEILSMNNETFGIMAINDDIGAFPLRAINNIIINYNIIKKEDIFVGIVRMIEGNTEKGIPIALQTNVTSIQNLNTKIYNNYYYFKKTKNNPLYYLCLYKGGSSYKGLDLISELILDQIHYKYNFRIQPFSIDSAIQVSNYGTGIYLTYPDELDFRSQNTFSVQFIMGNPLYGGNISINNQNSMYYSNNSYLNCENQKGVKKCNISLSYFSDQIDKVFDYYYIYHSYNEELKIDYGVSPIKIIFPQKLLNLMIESNSNKQLLCQNGTIYFRTNYTDTKNNIFDISTIEEQTSFDSTIKLNSSDIIYSLSCRLWKPKNNNLIIICKLNESLNFNEDIIVNAYFNDSSFYYKNYVVSISSYELFTFQILKTKCPFLYADEHIFRINENEESYELNFKIDKYFNEPLLLSTTELNYITLNNCTRKSDNLNCLIEKEKIMEQYNNQICRVLFFNEFYGFHELTLISNISFIFDIPKQNIYIRITKLLENSIYFNDYIPYETNVTNISNIITDFFFLDSDIICYLKKIENEPLILLCHWPFRDNYHLPEIKNEIYLDNINIKYNFVILPVNNSQSFNVEGSGSLISFYYPPMLDFSLNTSLTIGIKMQYPDNFNNISLGSASNYLNCENSPLLSNPYKRCIVHINYFENNFNQSYYPFYHINHLKGSSRLYELSPIQVKLIFIKIKKEENINSIVIGANRIFHFITDFYDNPNIINKEEEDIILFESKIIDENNNEYIVKCRFWNPKNDKVRIICNLNENLRYENQNITLKPFSLDLKGYHIPIESNTYFKAYQVNYNISFLYSDKQVINIYNDIESYQLIFKKINYYQEQLILYKEKLRKINLDCIDGEKDVICYITKKNLLTKIISNNEELFYIAQKTNNNELIPMNSVIGIIINYHNVIAKTSINLKITRLLTPIVELNNFIVFETNISGISRLTTCSFNLPSNDGSIRKCLFKKNNERSNDKLLLLCDATSPGKSSLGNIKETTLEEINMYYNFNLAAIQNNDYFTITNKEDAIIYSVYPEELDFNQNDSFIIRYEVDYPERLIDIKLNNDSSSELECKNLKGIKECIVPQSHFQNSGDYYTYHTNSLGYKSISYEVTTIKITLKNESGDESDGYFIYILSGSIVGGLLVIGIIIFIVLRCKRKRVGSDALKNKIISDIQTTIELKEEIE